MTVLRDTLVLLLLASAHVLAAADITGTVSDASGSPIQAAVVSTTQGTTTITVLSDSAGAFVLEFPGPSPRTLKLEIHADGYRPLSLAIDDPDREVAVILEKVRIFSGELKITGNRATVGETPVTLSNIGEEEIERQYWGQDLPMLLSQVPAFNAYNDNGNGIGYSYFTLRGFDMRRTSVTLNGVPLNDAASHGVFFIDLTDFLETTGDIQVQRGVGTSMYGNSALGGSIDLRTRTPLTERRLRLSTTYGSWNTSRFSLEYDSGLSDDGWASTFRYSRVSSDGYRDQSWVESWNYYATIERYGERSTTRIVLFGGPQDTHLAYLGVPRAYLDGDITGNRERDRRHNPLTYKNEIDHFFQPHYQFHHSWQLTEDIIVQNSLFFFQGDGYFEQYKEDRWMPEYDLEPFPGPGGELVEETDLVRRREVDEWDAGWIPRLEWQHGNGRGLLQAGMAIRLHESRHRGSTVWAQYYPPELEPNHSYYDYRVRKTTFQPFVQESWDFSDQWRLMAGLTWTSHDYTMDEDKRKDVEFSEDFAYLLPRLGLTYRPDKDWSFFVNASRGAREPTFRDIYDPQDYWAGPPNTLDYEDLLDYELGARHTWSSGFAAANVYWLDFDNAIVWAGGLDNNGVPVTANGAVVDQKGIEFEGAWMPRPRWGGQLALAFANAEFDHFVEYDWSGNPVDQSGNSIAAAPDILANLNLTGGAGPFDVLLTIRHVGRSYLDNTEDLRKDPTGRGDPDYVHRVNPSYTVADLAIRADLGPAVADWLAAKSAIFNLRVNNVTNELYTTFGYTDWPEPVWIPAATRGVYAGFVIDW